VDGRRWTAVALALAVAGLAGWLGWIAGSAFFSGPLWSLTLLPIVGLSAVAWRVERRDETLRLVGVFVLAWVMAFLIGVLA